MKKLLLSIGFVFAISTTAFADSFNSISIQGQLTSSAPIYGVQVDILSSGGNSTASEINLLPDENGVFSALTYITNPELFLTGSDFVMQLSSADATIISTFPISGVPFAITVRGDIQTGNQNVFGAYGNVGIGTDTPAYRLEISSAAGSSDDIVVISTGGSPVIKMTGAGEIRANKYYGDGSSLTGIATGGDNLGNHTATTDLNTSGYNLINVSTIVIQGDSIVISPNSQGNYEHSISIGPDSGSNYDYGIGIGNNASNNSAQGVGLGRDANHNSTGGVGIGKGAAYNNNLGVGLGTYSSDNYTEGVGIGYSASGNYQYGVGVGRSASSNYYYGTGVGSGANGNNNYGVGIGNEAKDNYAYGVGVGAYSQGNHNYGTSVGARTTSHSYSAALGYSASATNTEAVALGSNAQANAVRSVAIGAYTVNNTTSSVKIREGYTLQVDSISASGAPYITFSTVAILNGNIGSVSAVPQAALDIVSTGTASNIYAQIWRDGSGNIVSSMTSEGTLFPQQAGDNLGNHTATTDLAMANFNINNAGAITAYGQVTTYSSMTVANAGGVGLSKAYFNPNVEISSTPALQLGGVYVSTNIYIAGVSSATKYYGDGSALTALNADNLASGTVADGLLSSNIDLLNANQTIAGIKTFTSSVTITANAFSVGSTLVVNNGTVSIPNASITSASVPTITGDTTFTGRIIAGSAITANATSAPAGIAGKGVLYYDDTLNVFMVKENNGAAKPIVDPPGNWTCTIRTGASSCTSLPTATSFSVTASCSGVEKLLSYSYGFPRTYFTNSTCTSPGNDNGSSIFLVGASMSSQSVTVIMRHPGASGNYTKLNVYANCCL